MAFRVLHLVGSAASDFLCDLSRLYASDCLHVSRELSDLDSQIAYVTPDRQWRFPADLSREAIEATAPMACEEAIWRLKALELDAMVPQMFCLPGMTQYRALFDLLEIPYVGNPPDVMALTANKARARAVVADAGVVVPRGEVLRPGNEPSIEPPAVVKPVDADNSLGVALVRERVDYQSALDAAFEHSTEALTESYVELGREVRCGILVRGGKLVCLPLEEYALSGIRGYEDKIARDGDGELTLVAKATPAAWIVDPEDPITEPVWEAAKRSHLALGCRHYSLFDFRIDPEGRPWFLEAGLYCSFARQSVLAVMADAVGITAHELLDSALAESTGEREAAS